MQNFCTIRQCAGPDLTAPVLTHTKPATNFLPVAYTTRQKRVLADILKDASRPLTPQEICNLAKKEIPSLGIATVYRAIKQFVEEGSVRLVDIPGIAPHYESSAGHHHHFFLCNRCHRVFNLAGCLHDVNSLAPHGFQVEKHEIVLYGQCESCLAA